VTRWEVDRFADDLDGLALRWLRLRKIAAELAVLVNDFETAVGSKLANETYDPTEGHPLPNGELIHHTWPSNDRWQGRRLINDLGMPVVDPASGERLTAVPVAVLEQIIPGTSTDDLTSSSWAVRGLQNLGVDPDDYRTREWKPPKARVGVKR
jgi:hypothetical protein